ncbi:Wzz/FepE/Etk N-terminal domain-containing protein [Litoribacillus peritrichatus]|uniref:Wzz/FepE/Etk N-terminal domain-containing protein n=1 Tax=Litoribacillus peritrichatus TaxID=718191 RepID=A0ABP7LZA4_9GAMM
MTKKMNKPISPQLSDNLNVYSDGESDEIDLIELFHAIWSQKLKVIFITVIFAVCSVLYALSKPDLYKSEALLAPAESSSNGGGGASLAGQFGGLASIAGVDLGAGSSGKTEEAIAILKSREFITQFVRDNDLLIPLFALRPVRFSKEVLLDPEIYNEEKNEWVREEKPPYTKEPTDWEIYKKFSGILSVERDKVTGMLTISVEWYIPEQTQNWVTLLVEKINHHLKMRDVDEAKKSIQFIRQKIQEVSLVDMQAIFYGLIEAHGKTIMLAEVRDEYAFRTIDPAVIPLEKSEPKRALICIVGTLLGGMLGVLWVLVSCFFAKRRAENNAQR